MTLPMPCYTVICRLFQLSPAVRFRRVFHHAGRRVVRGASDAGDCRRRAALRMAAGVVRGDFRLVMMMIAGVAVLCRARLAALHAFDCRLFHISTPRRVPPQKLGA